MTDTTCQRCDATALELAKMKGRMGAIKDVLTAISKALQGDLDGLSREQAVWNLKVAERLIAGAIMVTERQAGDD